MNGEVSRQTSSAMVLGKALCIVALVFAAGDLWPSISIGFTFRFSQVCMLLALVLCPVAFYRTPIRTFPGWLWLYAFGLWVVACLPFSLYEERSLGYAVWAVTDVLIIFTFVQYFRTETDLMRLMRYFLMSFVILAAMGILQFALALLGRPVLVVQWWIPGIFPRINAISYEPSYYATYTLIGWVTSLYLLEKRAYIPSRRLQCTCAIATTAALMLATSRLGWAMMIGWIVLRAAIRVCRALGRGRIRRRAIISIIVSVPLLGASFLLLAVLFPRWLQIIREASFLLSGLGVLGLSAHSSAPREGDFIMTLRSFMAHPLIGTGIGALPAEIGAARGAPVATLAQAKFQEGMSIFAEILATTGILGGVLIAGFGTATVRACRRAKAQFAGWHLTILAALSWGMIWLLVALQFSQNFLRLWIFFMLAVLLCCALAEQDSATPKLAACNSPERQIESSSPDHPGWQPDN